jgi:cyclic beta-1,2-glucan synthetase
VGFGPGAATILREDDGIETRLDVIVSPDAPSELRRLTLHNRSDRPRTLLVTSYAELVLNSAAAELAHPTFSKLFVSTERVAGHPALLARRRPRGADERPLWLMHSLMLEQDTAPGSVETDRARFLGRGRTAANPIALESGEPLSDTVGNVLDPIVSIRHSVTLAPGSEVRLLASLGFGDSRDAVLSLVEAAVPWDQTRRAAIRRDIELRARIGITEALSGALPRLTGALLYRRSSLPSAEAVPDPVLLEQVRRAARWWSAQGLPVNPDNPQHEPLLRALTVLCRGSETPQAAVMARSSLAQGSEREPPSGEPLRQWNGTGGFSADGSEYVIRIPRDGTRPPLPWTNVIANERFGTVLSESGAAVTWCGNSREHRLTPWFNDPVSDPHGEALYVRDEETGRSWSPSPGPRPAAAGYEVCHGMGYTRFLLDHDGLHHDLVQFVPREGELKASRLRLTNTGPQPRRLAVYSYAQWVLGTTPEESASHLTTSHDPDRGAILARHDARNEYAGRVAFSTMFTPSTVCEATADRTWFLGRYGSTILPSAVMSGGSLNGRAGDGLDQCAAHRVVVTVLPGATVECTILLGESASAEAAQSAMDEWRQPAVVEAQLITVQRFWREMVTGLQVRTPVPALDLMVNGWLTYQNLSCRMWGRTAFYQSGGAFGFRDQLQDSVALLPLDPSIPRRQILLHAAHQFAEGDVLHWWHPPAGKGIRTRFADDLLWLPLLTAQYVDQTGDQALLDETAEFLRAPVLEAGQDEVFLMPDSSPDSGTIYEHCCRAIDRSLAVGSHGLPLFGTGDWNDGMNRVGREGRGESVWMGFFLARILEQFIPLARSRNDEARATRYARHRAALIRALNASGWDGNWYRRGYFDDGTPLGSAQSDECRIDAIAQAWSILSGAAPADRAVQALDALEAHLVSERDGIIRLLTPPFDRMSHDPGYIKGYLPGVRENGGQYTHAALWAVQALAEAGHGDRAARLLTMISPVTRGHDPASVARYQVEPYVIAADVYGVSPHIGRGGWTWYTGSAGWMFRLAIESILGVSLEGGRTLMVRPCLPESWPGCQVEYRMPGTTTRYRLDIRRAEKPSVRESTLTLDGVSSAVAGAAARVALVDDGATHTVEIIFHHSAKVSYRPRP